MQQLNKGVMTSTMCNFVALPVCDDGAKITSIEWTKATKSCFGFAFCVACDKDLSPVFALPHEYSVLFSRWRYGMFRS